MNHRQVPNGSKPSAQVTLGLGIVLSGAPALFVLTLMLIDGSRGPVVRALLTILSYNALALIVLPKAVRDRRISEDSDLQTRIALGAVFAILASFGVQLVA